MLQRNASVTEYATTDVVIKHINKSHVHKQCM